MSEKLALVVIEQDRDTAQELTEGGIVTAAIGAGFATVGGILKLVGFLKRRKKAKQEGENRK